LFYFVVFEAMFFDSISTTNSTTNSSDASKGIMIRLLQWRRAKQQNKIKNRRPRSTLLFRVGMQCQRGRGCMHGRGRGVALRDGLHFAALVRVLMLGHHKDCRVPAIGAIGMVAAHGKRVCLFAGHYVLPVWEVVVAHREYIYTYAAWSTSIQGTGVCKHAQVPAKSGARAQSAMRALACAYIYIYIYIQGRITSKIAGISGDVVVI